MIAGQSSPLVDYPPLKSPPLADTPFEAICCNFKTLFRQTTHSQIFGEDSHASEGHGTSSVETSVIMSF